MSAAQLRPSPLIQRKASKIRSILSSFTTKDPNSETDGAFSPHSHPPGDRQTVPSSSLSTEELVEWTTPFMPLLTRPQLELTLAEIHRRQRHYRAGRDQPEERGDKSSPIRNREASIFVPLCTVQGVPSILFTRRSNQLSSHASQISFPGGYFDESLDFSGDGACDTTLESFDMRLVRTALREMHEELRYDMGSLGIDAHSDLHSRIGGSDNAMAHDGRQKMSFQNNDKPPFLSILGQTQPVPSMTGNKVTPIVGNFNYDLPHFTTSEFHSLFRGNPEEVDWIFTVPLQELLSGETSEPLTKWGDHHVAKTDGRHKYYGPVYPVPQDERKKEGDRIWGLTASVLRPLLHKVFKPVFLTEE